MRLTYNFPLTACEGPITSHWLLVDDQQLLIDHLSLIYIPLITCQWSTTSYWLLVDRANLCHQRVSVWVFLANICTSETTQVRWKTDQGFLIFVQLLFKAKAWKRMCVGHLGTFPRYVCTSYYHTGFKKKTNKKKTKKEHWASSQLFYFFAGADQGIYHVNFRSSAPSSGGFILRVTWYSCCPIPSIGKNDRVAPKISSTKKFYLLHHETLLSYWQILPSDPNTMYVPFHFSHDFCVSHS